MIDQSYQIRFFDNALDAEKWLNEQVKAGWRLINIDPGTNTITNSTGDIVAQLSGLYVSVTKRLEGK
jgi:hypothetical protein